MVEWGSGGRQAATRSIARSPSSPAGSQASDAHWLRQARGKDLAGGYEAVPLVWCMHLAPDRSFSSSQRGPPRILYQQSVSRQERRRTASAERVVFDGRMIGVRSPYGCSFREAARDSPVSDPMQAAQLFACWAHVVQRKPGAGGSSTATSESP